MGRSSGIASASQAGGNTACDGCAVRSDCIIRRLLSVRRAVPRELYRTTLRFREGVFREGDACDALLIVVAGVVALRKRDEDGNSTLMELVHPGQALDWGALVPDSSHQMTAVCQLSAEVCSAPAHLVRSAIRAGGGAALALMQQVALDLERKQTSLLRHVTVPSVTRLKHALWQLAFHHARRQPDGTWLVDLPVSRRDLASMVGSRPETISRSLRAIELENLACFDGRHVIIPDLDRLRCGAARAIGCEEAAIGGPQHLGDAR